jgi:hypothetical protein
VDGVWGSETQASLRSFQHDHNLATNGQLDVPTLQALNLSNSWTKDAANNTPAPTQPNYNPPPAAAPVAPAPQR